MKKLSSELLDEITKRLANSIHPERIYLFGSHAAGTADQDSDVDLLIVVPDTGKSTREIARQGRARLWGLTIPLDLIVCTKSEFERYRHVANNVMNEAFLDGRIIYGT